MSSENERVIKLLVFLLLLKLKGFEIGGGATEEQVRPVVLEVSRFTLLFVLSRNLLVLLSVKNDLFLIDR